MKQDNKKKMINKVAGWVMFILFITFVTLYISQATGYYEYEQARKTAFTKEQIEQFEKDVKDGKEIDVNKYLENTDKNYQNSLSKFTLNVSEGISKYTKLGIEKVLGQISKWVEN